MARATGRDPSRGESRDLGTPKLPMKPAAYRKAPRNRA